MERINVQGKILNSSRLSAQIEKIPPEDSFHASKRGAHNIMMTDSSQILNARVDEYMLIT